MPAIDEMQFLKQVATDKNGKVLSENLYWISSENNYQALNSLPAPEIATRIKSVSGSIGTEYKVTIKNTGNIIAFMLSLRIAGKDSHQEILPSYWSDNYFSLMPGEERTVSVKVADSGMLEKPVLEFRAFNMPGYKSTDL